MFSHVFVGAGDVAASKKFYDAVLGAIGVPEGKADPKGRVFYRTKTGMFGLTKPIDGKAATHANGGTIGFACDSPEKQGNRVNVISEPRLPPDSRRPRRQLFV